MTDAIFLPSGSLRLRRRRSLRRAVARPVFGAGIFALGAWATGPVFWNAETLPVPTDQARVALPLGTAGGVAPSGTVLAPGFSVALLDAASSFGLAPGSFAETVPLGPDFQPRGSLPAAEAAEPASAASEPAPATLVPPTPPAAPARIAALEPATPMPVPAPRGIDHAPSPSSRPPALREAASQGPSRVSGRRLARDAGTTVVPASAPDNRNFIEKLFGMGQPSGPALAYAAPGDGIFGRLSSLGSRPALPYDRSTAVYDIAAHTVYLPDGTRLEAHSGLGKRLDDPRHVHESNRGATPPNVYELTPREQLFHGVQALRLSPVGGSGTFGRNGLLAHSYMLGPNGDSNGCVSFKDYNAFLQAYQTGGVRRLAVVARLN